MVFMPCRPTKTQRHNGGLDGVIAVTPAPPIACSKVVVPRKPTLTVVGAADVVLAIRPHLRLDQAQTVVNQYLRKCKTGFAGMIAREEVVSLMSSSGLTRDHEYLYKLHDRFCVSKRRAGGLRFREFVNASMTWYHRSRSESMTLQFLVFDLDRDGYISYSDSTNCLQYGMDVRLRDVLRSVKEGDRWSEMTFRNKCYEHDLRYFGSFALGPLGYAHCSRQASDTSSDAMDVANISGGSFAMGVSEISAALGQEMTVVPSSNQTTQTTIHTNPGSSEAFVPMAVALDIEFDSFAMLLPMAQVIN